MILFSLIYIYKCHVHFVFILKKKNIYNMQIDVVKVFLNEPCEMCWLPSILLSSPQGYYG